MNARNRSGQAPYLPGSNYDPRVLGNDPTATGFQQQQQQLQLRWLANNYGVGETRTLTMIALALDPADDPPVDPTKPAGHIGNTLRSYVQEVTGWQLYQIYALFEDPSITRPALNLMQPNISLGISPPADCRSKARFTGSRSVR